MSEWVSEGDLHLKENVGPSETNLSERRIRTSNMTSAQNVNRTSILCLLMIFNEKERHKHKQKQSQGPDFDLNWIWWREFKLAELEKNLSNISEGGGVNFPQRDVRGGRRLQEAS